LNAYGHNTFNDRKLIDDFWSLLEQGLNTVLFTLGGLAWGGIIGNNDVFTNNPDRVFTGLDWGYLFVLYCFLMLIRFFLVFSFYPMTYYTGLSTSWQEAVFESFAGLRGAVGISLALSIDNLILETGEVGESIQTSKLFGMIGGIAFLTLCVNATLSGPILNKLGLADKTEFRNKILSEMRRQIRLYMIENMATLLSQERFNKVSFDVIRRHVPMVSDLTKRELAMAVNKHHGKHGHEKRYRDANVDNILPFLEENGSKGEAGGDVSFHQLLERSNTQGVLSGLGDSPAPASYHDKGKAKDSSGAAEPLNVTDARRLFLDLLKASYAFMVATGELADREYLNMCLEKSLLFAAPDVNSGKPLATWQYTTINEKTLLLRLKHLITRSRFGRQWLQYAKMRFDVERSMAFLEAHRQSRNVFEDSFVGNADDLTKAEQTVMNESLADCDLAEKLRDSYPSDEVDIIVSHQFCITLINHAVNHIEKLTESGLLSEGEAADYLKDFQDQLTLLNACRGLDHPAELAGKGAVGSSQSQVHKSLMVGTAPEELEI